MSVLRLATNNVKRIALGGSEEDFIDVKVDLSKRDFNRLVTALPTDIGETGLTPEAAESFTAFLFEAFVVGWSVTDDAGNPVLPTLETYYNLTRDGATLIDNALIEHFNGLTPDEEERRKSEGLGE